MEIYLNYDDTFNIFVQRCTVFCSSMFNFINGISKAVILAKKSPESYPLDAASYKSYCIREPFRGG
jgi:hypothetical protein